MKVNGPYLNTDRGRYFVTLIYPDGRTRTTNYARYLMEQHLGRELDPDKETVDHINRNPLDDRIENLQLLSRAEHAALDARRLAPTTQACVYCGVQVIRNPNELNRTRSRKRSGPFCGKSCVGKYASEIRRKTRDALPVALGVESKDKQYFYRKKS